MNIEKKQSPDKVPDTNISRQEKTLLDESGETSTTKDEINLKRSALDNTDNDGEPLNEELDLSGRDLDIPGTEDDDANEDIGEEDEENNGYSEADTQ